MSGPTRQRLSRWERFVREQKRVLDGWVALVVGVALAIAYYGGLVGSYVPLNPGELTGALQWRPNVVVEMLVRVPAGYGAYRILSNLEYRVQHPNADTERDPLVSPAVRIAVALLVALLLR